MEISTADLKVGDMIRAMRLKRWAEYNGSIGRVESIGTFNVYWRPISTTNKQTPRLNNGCIKASVDKFDIL